MSTRKSARLSSEKEKNDKDAPQYDHSELYDQFLQFGAGESSDEEELEMKTSHESLEESMMDDNEKRQLPKRVLVRKIAEVLRKKISNMKNGTINTMVAKLVKQDIDFNHLGYII